VIVMSRRSPNKSSAEAHDRAFIRAIQETPDDDAPRLIYADWLDDHGDSDRAEFIRLQCRLASMAEDDSERPELLKREADLLKKHRTTWLGPWDAHLNEAVFQRGFLTTLRTGSYFRTGLEVLSEAISPYLDLVQTLGFRDNNKAEGLVSLLGQMSLPCLHRLECQGCRRGNAIIKALVRWLVEDGLTALVLRDCRIGSMAVKQLAAGPWLENLTVLDLAENRLSEASLRPLLESSRLRRLEDICLGWWRIELSVDFLQSLLRSRFLPALTALRVRGTMDDTWLSGLANCPELLRLGELDCFGCLFSDTGVAALARSPHVRNLSSLSLCLNQDRLNEATIRAVVESPHLEKLVSLRISTGASLSVRLTEAFGIPGRLPNLRELVLNLREYDPPAKQALVDRFQARGVRLVSKYPRD
jgi:uncharacterized protein (TIGR02996 family)